MQVHVPYGRGRSQERGKEKQDAAGSKGGGSSLSLASGSSGVTSTSEPIPPCDRRAPSYTPNQSLAETRPKGPPK